MPYTIGPGNKKLKRRKARAFKKLTKPIRKVWQNFSPLDARGDRPLQMTFEDQLNALIYFHLEEYTSGRHLLQALEENDFARDVIAPSEGIKKSSFFEAINNRGLEQLAEIFQNLYAQAITTLPKEYNDLGDLVSIDGSLIDAVLSMYWADYREGSKKAKVHIGFDLNHSITRSLPGSFSPTARRTSALLPVRSWLPDKQGLWTATTNAIKISISGKQRENILYAESKPVRRSNVPAPLKLSLTVLFFMTPSFYSAPPYVNQTEKEVRVVAYRVDQKNYWIATNRHDLSAEQIATLYKLRWNIEVFFGWWKRHLKVYHLIAWSWYGLMVQILAGLITYLLLAIYCHEQHHEKVSIKRIRQLRIQIQNEARANDNMDFSQQALNINQYSISAKT